MGNQEQRHAKQEEWRAKFLPELIDHVVSEMGSYDPDIVLAATFASLDLAAVCVQKLYSTTRLEIAPPIVDDVVIELRQRWDQALRDFILRQMPAVRDQFEDEMLD